MIRSLFAYCLFIAFLVPQTGFAQPALASPSNGATNQPTSLTLSWNSVALASSYEVQVSVKSDFSSTLIDKSTSSTSLAISGLSNSTTYYWRVRSSTLGVSGSWSTTWSFTTQASSPSPPSTPTLASPANGASGMSSSPTLQWNGASGATSYHEQVATTSGFTSPVSDQSGISGTSYQVSGLSNSTTYYWRVQAVNSAGSSSWSTTWSFTTQASSPSPPSTPTLASPANGASGASPSPVLQWNGASGATSYHEQVATTSGFTSPVSDQSGISGTSYQVSGLSNSTTYYWRVQ
ncbi:MAG TPA: fibronectin type III domain-containing protein, partial [Balneolales bacterium]|nr:fibronectin type III domain-containing protein [Balneolales bacterium]